MKKVIVIASAVISILFAVLVIIPYIRIPFQELRPIDTRDVIGYILVVGIILISLLVIFNIKLPKILRISLAIISVLIALLTLDVLGTIIAMFIVGRQNSDPNLLFSAGILVIVITMRNYIHQALKPVEVKENK